MRGLFLYPKDGNVIYRLTYLVAFFELMGQRSLAGYSPRGRKSWTLLGN